MQALTQNELNPMGCCTPGCTDDHSVLYMHPRCHDEGIEARYEKQSGHFIVSCAVCEREVIRVLVCGGSDLSELSPRN